MNDKLYCKVLGEDYVCPECGAVFIKDVKIGNGNLYDVCIWCGFVRKRSLQDVKVKVDEVSIL